MHTITSEKKMNFQRNTKTLQRRTFNFKADETFLALNKEILDRTYGWVKQTEPEVQFA